MQENQYSKAKGWMDFLSYVKRFKSEDLSYSLLILNVEITIMATKPELLVAKKEMLVAL